MCFSLRQNFQVRGDFMFVRCLLGLCIAFSVSLPASAQSLTTRIQGFVWHDANGDGDYAENESLLEGWVVFLDQNQNGVQDADETTATTNASGTYRFTDLAAGTYTVRLTHTAAWAIVHPHEEAYTFTLAEDGMQDFVDFGIADLASTSFGDFVWVDANENGIQDSDESGLADLSLYLFHARSGQAVDSTVTDTAGNYALTTDRSGSYFIAAFPPPAHAPTVFQEGASAKDSDLDPDQPFLYRERSGWRTSTFQAFSGTSYTEYDIGLRSLSIATLSIGDIVWQDDNQNGVRESGEPGLGGVTLTLREAGSDGTLDTSDDNTSFAPQVTATDGSYTFGTLLPGLYRVEIDATTLPSGYLPTYDPDGVLDHATEITLSGSTSHTDADFGFIEGATIGNFTWTDSNADGIQDSGEPGLKDVRVELYAADGTLRDTQLSNSSGFYSFTTVPGDYYLMFTPPTATHHASPPNATSENADSDIDQTSFETARFTTSAGQILPDWDAGFYQRTELGNLVWDDSNGNGQQDSGELGIAGVAMTLLTATGTTTATTTTDTNGRYLFSSLQPGTYLIEVTSPTGHVITRQDTGGDDTNDSDTDPTTGQTVPILLSSGLPQYTWDTGLFPEATISFESASTVTSQEGDVVTLILTLHLPGGGTLAHDVNVTLYDTGTGTATAGPDYTSGGPYSFVFSAGSRDGARQILSFPTANDDEWEGDETAIFGFSTTGPAYVGSPNQHTVTITDDDSPAVLVDPTTGLGTHESGGATAFEMVLNGQPSADVTVALTSSDTSEGILSVSSVTFTPTNWNTPQQIQVTGVDDALADGDQSYQIVTDASVSSDSNFHGLDPDDVTLINLDDDSATLLMVAPSPIETAEDGTSETIPISMTAQPTSDVMITITSTDATEGVVAPSTLVFTASNWRTSQAFTITGQDDTEGDGDQSYQIQFSITTTDPTYSTLTLSDLDALNADDEWVVQGRVWDDTDRDGIQDAGEVGVEGVELRISSTTATTDADGNYALVGHFGLPSTVVSTVHITPPTGYTLSAYQQGSDISVDNDFYPPAEAASVQLQDGTSLANIDAGLYDARLCGTYTIAPSGGDYAGFKDAVHDLTTRGISCAVVFEVASGTYAEAEALILDGIAGVSSTNTITFEAQKLSSKPLVTYSKADPFLTIQDPYITLHGIDMETTQTALLELASHDLSVISCALTAPIDNTAGHGDPLVNLTRTELRSTLVNLLLSDNTFTGAKRAIETSQSNLEVTIRSNTFYEQYVPIDINITSGTIEENAFFQSSWGIVVSGDENLVISRNTFSDLGSTAISLRACHNCEVSYNRIQGDGWRGLELNHTGSEAIDSVTVFNNMLAGYQTGVHIGENTQAVQFYHNTIRAAETALHVESTQVSDIHLINNILIGSTNTESSETFPVLTVEDGSVITDLDYNVYRNLNGTTHLSWNRTFYSSIRSWRSATGYDAHSLVKPVNFVATDDLHLSGTSIGDTDLAGRLLHLPDDVDGDTRLTICPYRGADESKTPLCGTAFIGIINGIPDPSIRSIRADLNGDDIGDALQFRERTDWIPLEPGTHVFSVFDAGANKKNTLLLEQSLTIAADTRYLLTTSGVRESKQFTQRHDGHAPDLALHVFEWPTTTVAEDADLWATVTHTVSDAGPVTVDILGTRHTLDYGASARLPLILPDSLNATLGSISWDSLFFDLSLPNEQLDTWQGQTIPLLLSGFQSPASNEQGPLMSLHAVTTDNTGHPLSTMGYFAATLWNDLDGNGTQDWAEPQWQAGQVTLEREGFPPYTLAPTTRGLAEAWLPYGTYTLVLPELPHWQRSDSGSVSPLHVALNALQPAHDNIMLGLHERAATFDVTSVDDSPDATRGDGVCATATGSCSLRAALEEANASPGRDRISLDLFSDGPTVLQLQTPLPELTEGLVLTSQGNVILDGSQLPSATAGLILTSGNSVVSGLTFRNFNGPGLLIGGSAPNRIVGNHFSANGGGIIVTSGTSHFLSENTFAANRDLAIDLGHDGATTNDPLDADDGPNALLNAPVLEHFSPTEHQLTGVFQGKPHQTIRIALYTSLHCSAHTWSEGTRFVGYTDGETDATGRFVFIATTPMQEAEAFVALAHDVDGNTSEFSPCLPSSSAVHRSMNDGTDLPITFALGANYPNPFNPTTTIPFSLPDPSSVTISVYNMAGQLVASIEQSYAAGHHHFVWDASGQASGVYLLRLRARSERLQDQVFEATQTLLLLK